MTRPEETVARGYDRIADRYLTWSSDHSVRLRWLVEFAAALPTPAGVLDLGCGAGVPVARWLVDAGYEVTGIDLSSEQIARATANVPEATFRVGSMTGASFDHGMFDGIVSTYAITHVPREQHAGLLRRVHEWLRPDGVFMASLGAGDSPDWTGEWLGAEMVFSHFDAETNLGLLTGAG
ncbi:MAG: class I SAM-dependent methyltransferase, partial [Chloroflexota bacterium]|nr:class I SAM-dependent methyltransferase [Chloroflexota bacterium]